MTRARALAVVVLGGAAIALPVAECWPRTPPPACGPSVRLLSANLLMVNPSPAELADEIAAADADVLALQEYSPRWEAALAGVRARYPYGVDVVREDSFGVALWSRVPLAGATTWPLDGLPQAEGTLRIGAGNVTIWSVHVLPPRNAEYWKAHAAEVDLLATAVENETRSLVVTGDFNAPAFSPFHHRMLRTLNDAWNLAGAGYGATWPNGVFPLPPLRLDHIYLSPDLTVTAIRIGTGAHSDHRPLVAELAPRAGGGLCPG